VTPLERNEARQVAPTGLAQGSRRELQAERIQAHSFHLQRRNGLQAGLDAEAQVVEPQTDAKVGHYPLPPGFNTAFGHRCASTSCSAWPAFSSG